MKKIFQIVLFAFAITVMGACGSDKPGKGPGPKSAKDNRLAGDSCIYGLACDGCTDSVLVLLPEDEGDPIRYEIIDARHMGKVFGRPKIGDRMALLVDPEDSLVADFVIDMDQLKGTWCYTVMPQMRAFENMSKRLQRRMERNMPDSLKQQLLVPREYGFTLSSNYTARPVGMVMRENALDDDSPVVYPELKTYSEWHIWNGKLVLTHHPRGAMAQGKKAPKAINDTTTIKFLGPDSLSIEFSDGSQQGYYRRSKAK